MRQSTLPPEEMLQCYHFLLMLLPTEFTLEAAFPEKFLNQMKEKKTTPLLVQFPLSQ